MDFELFNGLTSGGQTFLLILCLLIALGFEVVNGFHDTANAVATVIYTRSLRPWVAVIWSGICNFFGVFLGGIAVALAIVHLLPVDLLIAKGTGGGLAAVLALLVSAVLWNLATWYKGLPASSSHTLIGAILGVGIANSLLPGHVFGDGVNWSKAEGVGLALLISPLIGFTLAGILLWLSKRTIRKPYLYDKPSEDTPPPLWIRSLLILTCTGVSFAHGSNDGQKGVGLIMLVLIGILPAQYALNTAMTHDETARTLDAVRKLEATFASGAIREPVREGGATMQHAGFPPQGATSTASRISTTQAVQNDLALIRQLLEGKNTPKDVPQEQRWEVRKSVLRVDNAIAVAEKNGNLMLAPEAKVAVRNYRSDIRAITDYAPSWVMVAVALALGFGTMIGWKRIVVTVGEKIGMGHLSYAQGASAELVAMSTIGISAVAGLPVSTTHVLASGVAGTMVANSSGLQTATVRKIALAWLLTLPASMLLAGGLYLVFRLFV